jgi:hypothetical protein
MGHRAYQREAAPTGNLEWHCPIRMLASTMRQKFQLQFRCGADQGLVGGCQWESTPDGQFEIGVIVGRIVLAGDVRQL